MRAANLLLFAFANLISLVLAVVIGIAIFTDETYGKCCWNNCSNTCRTASSCGGCEQTAFDSCCAPTYDPQCYCNMHPLAFDLKEVKEKNKDFMGKPFELTTELLADEELAEVEE